MSVPTSTTSTHARLAADLPGRIPSLDGLRAVSIALVLVSHTMFSSGTRNPAMVRAATSLGAFGVGVFFVISGFLITHLLLKETDRTGTISLRQFYLRRSFRILPAYYAMLGCVLVLQRARVLGLPTRDLLAAATFTWNYSTATNTWLGHTWSLCVEEQFYLFWPAMLWLVGPRRALRIALVLLVTVPLGRIAAMTCLPPSHYLVSRMGILGHARIDSLMYGCVAALLLGNERFRRGVLGFIESGGGWAVATALAASLALSQVVSWYWTSVGLCIDGTCVALAMIWFVCRPEGLCGRWLNHRVVIHVGLISFSLYLWQQLFLNEKALPILRTFPIGLACAALAAEGSYWLIERPFLRMRRHYTTGGSVSTSERNAPSTLPMQAGANLASAPPLLQRFAS